jgi:hypothetical protein
MSVVRVVGALMVADPSDPFPNTGWSWSSQDGSFAPIFRNFPEEPFANLAHFGVEFP